MHPSKTTTVKGPYPTCRPYFSTLLAPQCLRRTVDAGGDRYGVRYHTTEKTTSFTREGKVGVIVEDTLIIATLIFGGTMGEFPDLQVASPEAGAPPASAWANRTGVVR